MVIYSQESQCGHKRNYRRRHDAKKALRQQQTSGRSGTRLCVYRCPHCGAYHIGNDTGAR